MQDKVVMGCQEDGLRGMTRFSDNEGDIIWPGAFDFLYEGKQGEPFYFYY